ncbi:MAG: hypothetical protein J5871_00615, partial [Bacteroidales bacterium]|nr:hypothetical protein [Bacteroidales bacterium]
YAGRPNLPKCGDVMVAHTTIYDGGFMNEDNRLCGVDLISGEVKWFFPTDTESRYYCYFNGNGYVYGEKLVFQYQADARTYEARDYHTTVCIDAKTGEILWAEKGKSGYSSVNVQVVGDDVGRCFFLLDSTRVRCADLQAGTVADFFDSDTLQINDLSLSGNSLVLSCCSKSGKAYHYRSYAIVLDKDSGGEQLFVPLVENRILPHCILCQGILWGNVGTFISAVDVKNGKWLWSRDDWCADYVGDIGVYGDVLMKCAEDAITGYNVKTGEVVYSYPHYGAWHTSFDGRYAYLINRKNKLDIIDIETGKILDTVTCKYDTEYDGFGLSYPMIYNGKLYIMGGNSLFRYSVYPWKR